MAIVGTNDGQFTDAYMRHSASMRYFSQHDISLSEPMLEYC